MEGKGMKQIRLISTAVITLLVLGACGYQLIGGKGIYGGDISSIYVSVFQNLTYEPHISQPVTESFSRELVSTGLFTLNEQSADGYLKGEITDVKTAASSLDATGVVIEKSGNGDRQDRFVREERKARERVRAFRFRDIQSGICRSRGI